MSTSSENKDLLAWGTLGAFQRQKSCPYVGFFGSSLPVKSYDTDKRLFFGRNGSLESPAAVRRGMCGNKVAFGYSDVPDPRFHAPESEYWRRGLASGAPHSCGARRMSDLRKAGNVPVDLNLVREKLARRYGGSAEASEWARQYERTKSAVEQYAWDGAWYTRVFTDEGEPVGSSKDAEGNIYLEVQAVAVLSGVADADRAAKCLKSVDDLLMTELGPRLCAPYTKPDYHVGITADFVPVGAGKGPACANGF